MAGVDELVGYVPPERFLKERRKDAARPQAPAAAHYRLALAEAGAQSACAGAASSGSVVPPKISAARANIRPAPASLSLTSLPRLVFCLRPG